MVVIETMFSHCRFFGLELSDVSLMFFYAELDGSSTLSDVHLAAFAWDLYMSGVLNPGASVIGGM